VWIPTTTALQPTKSHQENRNFSYVNVNLLKLLWFYMQTWFQNKDHPAKPSRLRFAAASHLRGRDPCWSLHALQPSPMRQHLPVAARPFSPRTQGFMASFSGVPKIPIGQYGLMFTLNIWIYIHSLTILTGVNGLLSILKGECKVNIVELRTPAMP